MIKIISVMVAAMLAVPSVCLAATAEASDNTVIDNTEASCDSTGDKSRFYIFLSDVYVGWGGNHVEAPASDAIKSTVWEAGVLNFASLGYNFNQDRSRLSLGVGFNWTHYGLRKDFSWYRGDGGVLGWMPNAELYDEQYDKSRSSLTLYSMQLPLMFNQSLGKKWDVAVAGILNWNYYAHFTNNYSLDHSDYHVTTHGLKQRKVSFDLLGQVSWHGIGAYLRYSPQSVFKTGYGPEMKNRWTLGIVLRGALTPRDKK